jgi:glycerol-3-phosphate acyltransferase PlsY
MALIENITLAPSSGLISDVLDKLLNLPGVSTLVKILQAVGIVLFIYFIFLIIRVISQIRHNTNIRRLAQNVEEINKKMDLLVGKKIKKK